MANTLSKTLETKIERYNVLLTRERLLRYEIENELERKHCLSEDLLAELGVTDSLDEEFDVERLKKVVSAINYFERKDGEFPEPWEIKSRMKDMSGKRDENN